MRRPISTTTALKFVVTLPSPTQSMTRVGLINRKVHTHRMARMTPPTTLRISKGLFTDKAPFEEDIYKNDCSSTQSTCVGFRTYLYCSRYAKINQHLAR